VNADPHGPGHHQWQFGDLHVGTQGSFSVMTTGSPTAAITESGTLPSGVTFTDNGNGTATLAGTAGGGDQRQLPDHDHAANGVRAASPELHAHRGPGPRGAGHHQCGSATFAAGQAGTFTVTTTGYPAPALSATSSPALPSGVTFTDNGNGTATLAGTPPPGSQGTYMLTINAGNSAGTASQSFTLTVSSGLAITSAAAGTATAGQAFSFTVTTTGSPAPTLTRAGTLPSGITFTANSNGTATLAGTPAAGDSGSYPLTFTAKNSSRHDEPGLHADGGPGPSFSSAAASHGDGRHGLHLRGHHQGLSDAEAQQREPARRGELLRQRQRVRDALGHDGGQCRDLHRHGHGGQRRAAPPARGSP
jgi:hypothetical protein